MTYALLCAGFVAVALVAALVAWRRAPRGYAWALALSAAALVVLTAIFDNVMIGAGLFGYADGHISGVRLGLAPIEDFAYPIAGVLLLPALWVLLGRRAAAAGARAGGVVGAGGGVGAGAAAVIGSATGPASDKAPAHAESSVLREASTHPEAPMRRGTPAVREASADPETSAHPETSGRRDTSAHPETSGRRDTSAHPETSGRRDTSARREASARPDADADGRRAHDDADD